jgi:hypothetical protein
MFFKGIYLLTPKGSHLYTIDFFISLPDPEGVAYKTNLNASLTTIN